MQPEIVRDLAEIGEEVSRSYTRCVGSVAESSVKTRTGVTPLAAKRVSCSVMGLNTQLPNPSAREAFSASPTVSGVFEVGTACVRSSVMTDPTAAGLAGRRLF